jgi:hypothetical protein
MDDTTALGTAQGGHNHLRHTPGDASGGETTMKANT